MRPLTIRRVVGYCLILLAVALPVVLVSLKFGAVPVSLYGLGRDLVRVALGKGSELSSEYRLIVFDIRLPRIVLGLLVGAALSVAGTSFQALLRNPLADPYVLGVSSGAALGAILSIVLEPFLHLSAALSAFLTPMGAFLGALGTIVVVYFLGRKGGQLNSATLLLAGVISASFLSSIIIFLMTTLTGGYFHNMAFWLMGDLSTAPPWQLIGFLGIGILLATAAIYTTAVDLNLLLAGEQEAIHLGVDIRHVRLIVYVGASVLTALAVSFGGAVGYVGLLVPHAMRFLFGPDHRVLLPTAALGGAIAVVIADTLARTVVAPRDLPIGAVTAVVGAPFFIYLMRRRLA